ncbi:unnamed protein product, partial [Amoebophrya sp. A25]|eukprot:GSA25T00006412001.1
MGVDGVPGSRGGGLAGLVQRRVEGEVTSYDAYLRGHLDKRFGSFAEEMLAKMSQIREDMRVELRESIRKEIEEQLSDDDADKSEDGVASEKGSQGTKGLLLKKIRGEVESGCSRVVAEDVTKLEESLVAQIRKVETDLESGISNFRTAFDEQDTRLDDLVSNMTQLRETKLEVAEHRAHRSEVSEHRDSMQSEIEKALAEQDEEVKKVETRLQQSLSDLNTRVTRQNEEADKHAETLTELIKMRHRAHQAAITAQDQKLTEFKRNMEKELARLETEDIIKRSSSASGTVALAQDQEEMTMIKSASATAQLRGEQDEHEAVADQEEFAKHNTLMEEDDEFEQDGFQVGSTLLGITTNSKKKKVLDNMRGAEGEIASVQIEDGEENNAAMDELAKAKAKLRRVTKFGKEALQKPTAKAAAQQEELVRRGSIPVSEQMASIRASRMSKMQKMEASVRRSEFQLRLQATENKTAEQTMNRLSQRRTGAFGVQAQVGPLGQVATPADVAPSTDASREMKQHQARLSTAVAHRLQHYSQRKNKAPQEKPVPTVRNTDETTVGRLAKSVVNAPVIVNSHMSDKNDDNARSNNVNAPRPSGVLSPRTGKTIISNIMASSSPPTTPKASNKKAQMSMKNLDLLSSPSPRAVAAKAQDQDEDDEAEGEERGKNKLTVLFSKKNLAKLDALSPRSAAAATEDETSKKVDQEQALQGAGAKPSITSFGGHFGTDGAKTQLKVEESDDSWSSTTSKEDGDGVERLKILDGSAHVDVGAQLPQVDNVVDGNTESGHVGGVDATVDARSNKNLIFADEQAEALGFAVASAVAEAVAEERRVTRAMLAETYDVLQEDISRVGAEVVVQDQGRRTQGTSTLMKTSLVSLGGDLRDPDYLVERISQFSREVEEEERGDMENSLSPAHRGSAAAAGMYLSYGGGNSMQQLNSYGASVDHDIVNALRNEMKEIREDRVALRQRMYQLEARVEIIQETTSAPNKDSVGAAALAAASALKPTLEEDADGKVDESNELQVSSKEQERPVVEQQLRQEEEEELHTPKKQVQVGEDQEEQAEENASESEEGGIAALPFAGGTKVKAYLDHLNEKQQVSESPVDQVNTIKRKTATAELAFLPNETTIVKLANVERELRQMIGSISAKIEACEVKLRARDLVDQDSVEQQRAAARRLSKIERLAEQLESKAFASEARLRSTEAENRRKSEAGARKTSSSRISTLLKTLDHSTSDASRKSYNYRGKNYVGAAADNYVETGVGVPLDDEQEQLVERSPTSIAHHRRPEGITPLERVTERVDTLETQVEKRLSALDHMIEDMRTRRNNSNIFSRPESLSFPSGALQNSRESASIGQLQERGKAGAASVVMGSNLAAEERVTRMTTAQLQ